MPLWQWYAIPGTALSSVEPAVRSLGWTGPQAKIVSWCGAALKRRGSVYILGAAGGHADYAGNEVNALNLYSENPQWVELRGPTPNEQILNDVQFYLDGRPAATHTYSASHFVGRTNRLVVIASPGLGGPFPTAPAGYPYGGDKRSYSFNYSANDWDHPDYMAKFPGAGDFTSCLCVKHPLTDDIYYSRNYGDGWYRWASAYNRWDKLSNETRGPWYVGAAIDPTRDRMLLVGGYTPAAPEVRALNGSKLSVSFGGLGAGALTVAGYPSVVYDEANDAFLVAFNGNGIINLLRVDAGTFNVTAPAFSGTAPASRDNGVHNALQYVPELRGVVVANSYSGNVHFMRVS